MDGEQPAVDFYVNYGPAQFYIVAWIFKVFRPSVIAGRVTTPLRSVRRLMWRPDPGEGLLGRSTIIW
jgi:hypothetical protein